MRRSLAPSQLSSSKPQPCNVFGGHDGMNIKASLNKTTVYRNNKDESNMITIRRLPLFDFLEIPEGLSKTQFKVPSGCVVTEK